MNSDQAGFGTPQTSTNSASYVPVPTSSKALASLILGILSCLLPCITGLPAIILAILALRDISRSQPKLGGRGIAVAGLLLGVVAIVLLGAISALTAVAVRSAFANARAVAVRTEVMQLERAIEYYRAEYGEFPPNLGDAVAVERHLRKAFPRSTRDATPPPVKGGAAQSLVFWLRGFSRDPRDPLKEGGDRTGPLFDFDESRLRDGRYYPGGSEKPYVYFSGQSYENASFETLKPYQLDQGGYVNPRGFQIIAAGQDNAFGTGGKYPSAADCSSADLDNITNFTSGVTLEDDMP